MAVSSVSPRSVWRDLKRSEPLAGEHLLKPASELSLTLTKSLS
jgi:hypothetical protein